MNPLLVNPIMNQLMESQNYPYNSKNKNNKILLKIKNENGEFFTIECLATDQISIIRKKCDIKGKYLIYNYFKHIKILREIYIKSKLISLKKIYINIY